ncbi:MAG: hypothetical protein A2086_10360 [Spirochaetes bacterium GWD1_27_9]|nr:MAG: hypothetical protein A2Z98_14300 [Spirochaetes bacterium GWB1_27_13]OHD27719.1 MAG: hypothetical protein A2Y34_08800 [Spirochaetes bacterium GWC1_27_15]OHD43680.1 MAG: hypothetical protein A2086_10360 [Spirochaetes bacterium GWD1_27_9]
MEEKEPYKLPEGWKWVKLGEVAEKVQYGYTEKATNEKIGPKFLRITDIQDNFVDWENVPYCSITEKEFEKFKLKNNDIVIARTGATTGKSFLLKNPDNAVFASYLIRITLNELAECNYSWFFMKSHYYWKQITEQIQGIAQPGVNATKLAQLLFPLPPLEEQQRIANILDNLTSKLAEAKELINDARETFEKRRMAILHKAFTGTLTKHWREENKDLLNTDEFANIEEVAESERPYELPDRWKWARLGSICEKITDGTHQTPTYTDNGVIFLSSKNVTSRKIDWDNIKYIPEELHIELSKRVAPRLNDILLAKNGTTGVAAIVDRDLIFDIYVSLALLRSKKMVYPFYLLNLINSRIAKEQFNSRLKGIGVPNLHLKEIKEVKIPLPPLAEQKEIVKILENLLSKEEEAKALTDLEEQIELMEKSILSKAFRGEL